MGKSKSKPENKSEHSTPHLNLPERMTLPANIPQIPKTIKLAWLSPKTTPLLETTSTHSNSGSNFSKFAEQAAQQQKQRMKEIVDQEEISREQDIIKPLLVQYLNRNGYLNKKNMIFCHM
jgi:DNA-directed RNA polymerase specialized sigma54-like protein